MKMESGFLLDALMPSWNCVGMLVAYLAYLAIASIVLPGKVVLGVMLQDGSHLRYRCNGLATLLSLIGLLGIGSKMNLISPTLIADRGLELLSTTLIFCFFVSSALYIAGRRCRSKTSSLKPHLTGDLVLDWYMGVQLNPHFMGMDLKFLFLRAGMVGWILINLSNLAKSVEIGSLSLSMILYQLFCLIHVIDFFYHEEQLTSFWDLMNEKLGFMLVCGWFLWAMFLFSIQGWWLVHNKVELTTPAALACCLIFLVGLTGYRGSNTQKYIFKKNPKALIWGKPPKLIGGKLLASGYWGITRHYNYFADFLLSLSFSLVCGMSSPIPYIYPALLVIFLVSRDFRDEAKCAEKYKEIWEEYCKVVPWRIVPYLY